MQREEHQRLFGDSRSKTFQIAALEETYAAAQQIAAENKWAQDYANLVIFANGVSFLQAKTTLDKVDTGQLKADEAIAQLTKQVQEYMGMYAVMKYQAFLKTNDNEAMDMALNALRKEKELFKKRIEMFREEEGRLKGELRRLSEESAALQKKVEEL